MSRLLLSLMLLWATVDEPDRRSSPWAGLMSRLVPEASGIVKSRRHPGHFLGA